MTKSRFPHYRHLCHFLFLVLIFFSACSFREKIKIGILTELTGRAAAIGIAGRDGAILAVEEANKKGGIQGKKLELVIRNASQDEDKVREAVAELATAKVTAIIGPATSASGLVIVPEINKRKLPTISPTVSTDLLAGKDDFFFRIMPVSSAAAKETAEYAYYRKGLRNLVVVYDQGNKGYTEPYYQVLKTNFENLGDGKVQGVGYVSGSGYDFLALTRIVIGHEMDGLVILASGLDTALICQQLAKLRVQKPILSCEWALTNELVEFGGKSIEGVEIFHSFDRNSMVDSYREFDLRFQRRFGYSANFASAYGYNAMNVLLQALAKNPSSSPEELKVNILQGSPYEGVQSEIRFDKYGDADREYSLKTIRNGRIVTM